MVKHAEYQIQKRNGKLVPFNKKKIKKAILLAMEKTNTVDVLVSDKIADNIENIIFGNKNKVFNVEEIQDLVINQLNEFNFSLALIEYITYREKKAIERSIKEKYNLKNDDQFEFISKYKKKEIPFTNLGRFVYYRTYSRFIEELNRREFWYETVLRAVKYNTSILPTSKKEKEKLFDNIFNLRQFLSGRTLWSGGTKASLKYPMSNFNCAFVQLNSFEKLSELFFTLMLGCGVGIRVCKEDIECLPPVRQNFIIKNKEYNEIPKHKRSEYTDLDFSNDNKAIITIGDSKEGWIQSVFLFFKLLTEPIYDNITEIEINYDNIRPAGERLVTFGGTASGYQSMLNMFNNFEKVMHDELDPNLEKIKDGKLRGIHILDIATSIAYNVVVGGVRRSSMICLFDKEDKEILNCKNLDNINKYGLYHRYMSNNSIFFEQKPSLEEIKDIINSIRNSGEPGFVNYEEIKRRRPDAKGLNPCGVTEQ